MAEKPEFPIPQTVDELVRQLPDRFRPELANGWESTIHFCLTGSDGGNYTVTIQDGTVLVKDDLHGVPDLVLKGKAKTYWDLEFGKTSPQMAFLFGGIHVSDMQEMMKVVRCFHRVSDGL